MAVIGVFGKLGASVEIASTRVTKTPTTFTLTTGGAAQQGLASNASRNGWEIQNNSTALLWFDETGSTAVQAAPSLCLYPGQYYSPLPHQLTTAAISIIGPVTGQKASLREW